MEQNVNKIRRLVTNNIIFNNTGAGIHTIFIVDGFVKIKIYTRCKTSLVGESGITLGITGNSIMFIDETLSTDLTSGLIWLDPINNALYSQFYEGIFDFGLGNNQDIILTTSDIITSGELEFACEYTPLSNNARIYGG